MARRGRGQGKSGGKGRGTDLSPGGEIRCGGAAWQRRIREAKPVSLERWFKRAIVAPDLPSVFNPSR